MISNPHGAALRKAPQISELAGATLDVAPPSLELSVAVANGLSRPQKSLPAWVLYDATGSRLYERITELPEYYPTRTERGILERNARTLAALAAIDAVAGTERLSVAELGAGVASKSQLFLRAVVAQQGRTRFVPADLSKTALDQAVWRLTREEPWIDVEPVLGDHPRALAAIRELPGRQVVMFLGSSIGNYSDEEAIEFLRGVRNSVRDSAVLLLGTDLQKSEELLVPAYDDRQGVTAEFNKNVLRRINRELGAHFDLAKFRHVALWNAEQSRIEMHLESLVEQVVSIPGLGIDVSFRVGERIHTESSKKYDLAMVKTLLSRSGFELEETFYDADRLFALHLARSV